MDSWADMAERSAKGQDRTFARGGFSDDLSSFSSPGGPSSTASGRASTERQEGKLSY